MEDSLKFSIDYNVKVQMLKILVIFENLWNGFYVISFMSFAF